LKYDGDEPIWAHFDFRQRLKLGPYEEELNENDPVQLQREIERLKMEKRDLAAELQKTQNKLKMQVDIDKQNANMHQNEINQLNSTIVEDNKRISDYNNLINARSYKLFTI